MTNSEPSLIYAIDKATGHLVSIKDVPLELAFCSLQKLK